MRNSILQAHLESIEEDISIPNEETSGFQDGQEVIEAENEATNLINDVDQLETAKNELEVMHESGEASIEKIENGEVSEDIKEEEVAEGVIEDLPEDDQAAAEIIVDKMAEEHAQLENIFGRLGIQATKTQSATDKFYSDFGIRVPKNSKQVKKESRASSAGSRKSTALAAYKTHVEGIGSALQKAGKFVWEGIKSAIKAVIDFIKMLKDKFLGLFKKKTEEQVNEAKKIRENIENYDLLQDFKENGYKKVNPGSVVFCIKNLDVYKEKLIQVEEFLSKSFKHVEEGFKIVEKGNSEELTKFENDTEGFSKILDELNTNLKGKEIEMMGAKFSPKNEVYFPINGIKSKDSQENEVTCVSVEIGKAYSKETILDRIEKINDINISAEMKKLLGSFDEYNKNLQELQRLAGIDKEYTKEQHQALKKAGHQAKEFLKQVKLMLVAPKQLSNGASLGLSFIVNKETGIKGNKSGHDK